MKVLFKWEKCSRFKDRDAYFIEVPIREMTAEIKDKLTEADRQRIESGLYIEEVNSWARVNPRLAKPDHIYLLFSKDGRECSLEMPWYPYSGQWNFFNPFTIENKKIIALTDLL